MWPQSESEEVLHFASRIKPLSFILSGECHAYWMQIKQREQVLISNDELYISPVDFLHRFVIVDETWLHY